MSRAERSLFISDLVDRLETALAELEMPFREWHRLCSILLPEAYDEEEPGRPTDALPHTAEHREDLARRLEAHQPLKHVDDGGVPAEVGLVPRQTGANGALAPSNIRGVFVEDRFEAVASCASHPGYRQVGTTRAAYSGGQHRGDNGKRSHRATQAEPEG